MSKTQFLLISLYSALALLDTTTASAAESKIPTVAWTKRLNIESEIFTLLKSSDARQAKNGLLPDWSRFAFTLAQADLTAWRCVGSQKRNIVVHNDAKVVDRTSVPVEVNKRRSRSQPKASPGPFLKPVVDRDVKFILVR